MYTYQSIFELVAEEVEFQKVLFHVSKGELIFEQFCMDLVLQRKQFLVRVPDLKIMRMPLREI